MELKIQGSMTQGARDYQEDYYEICTEQVKGSDSCLVVLCDGMGGHSGGALASHVVVTAFINEFITSSSLTPKEAFTKSLEVAHRAIKAEVNDNSAPPDMGTTLVAVYVNATDLHWLSVGDSHLYLYRKGKVRKLNEDHSMAAVLDELVEIGRLGKEEALSDPQRNALRSCVSVDDISLVDIQSKLNYLDSKDRLVLASDGLDTITLTEMEVVISNNTNKAPEVISSKLLSAVEAVEKPNQDNTSVVVVSLNKKTWL
ncbi:MAG: serine/threonine protein phosphatase [Piscirickettsiaceae bacterium]|nr:MAG: serine/threonine protein phosphatase [Piscirickettsiaceae bacterium]